MSKRKKKANSNNASNAENKNLTLVSKEDEEMNAIGVFEKMGKKIDGFRKSKAGKATGIVAIIGAIGFGIWQVITHFFKNDEVAGDDDLYDDCEEEEYEEDSEDSDSDDASED